MDGVMDGVEGAAAWAAPRVEAAWVWLREQGPGQAIGLAVFVGLFVVLRIARAFLCGVLHSKKASDTAARNVASRLIGGTQSLFLLILSAALVAPFVPNTPPVLVGGVERIFQIAVILQGAIWLRELVAALTSGFARSQASNAAAATAVSLITTISGIIIWTFAIIMVLNSFGVEVGPLVAGLGVGGLAIGLAAQSIFRDLFSSLSIVFDRPFTKGDTISFNEGAVIGVVERVGMKTTRLRALTGEQVVVSNSQILDKELRNFQRLVERRATHEIGVVYQTPHEVLRQIPAWIEEAAGAVDGARCDRCHLKAYGASAIVFELVFWAERSGYREFMDVQEAVLMAVHAVFEEAGVSFAYPTRTIHLAGGAAPASS